MEQLNQQQISELHSILAARLAIGGPVSEWGTRETADSLNGGASAYEPVRKASTIRFAESQNAWREEQILALVEDAHHVFASAGYDRQDWRSTENGLVQNVINELRAGDATGFENDVTWLINHI